MYYNIFSENSRSAFVEPKKILPLHRGIPMVLGPNIQDIWAREEPERLWEIGKGYIKGTGVE